MTVVQGGWATEARAPIAATVIAAFRQLEFENKKCFWLAGSDHELIMDLTKSQGGFEVCRFYDDVERLYAASDVIVTKGTYGATIEAASLGVHSVSISHASNPVDEILVPRIRSNIALSASATDGDVLADRLRSLVSLQKGPEPLLIHESGASKAALAIVLETERILGRNLGRMQVG
jgi:predicted glycosyltransferase